MTANTVFLVVGDANADVAAPVAAFPVEGDDVAVENLLWTSGGSATNVATGLALLDSPVRLLARVGSDPAATVALHAAVNAGVDLSLVQHDHATATGICYAVISPAGERTFLSYRGANVALGVPQSDMFAEAGWLHIAGHALLEGRQRETSLVLIEQARQHNIPISLDLCLPLVRTHGESTRALVPGLRVLFGNAAEMDALAPPTAPETLFVIKRGADGCEVRGTEQANVSGFSTLARDTNGCGDAFIAAFLHAIVANRSAYESALVANAAGAIAASRSGAAEAMPSLADLRAFLRERAPDACQFM